MQSFNNGVRDSGRRHIVTGILEDIWQSNHLLLWRCKCLRSMPNLKAFDVVALLVQLSL